MTALFLASKSPRRRELLGRIITDFEILDVDVEEVPLPGEAPEEYVLRVAKDKACAANKAINANGLVISADTEVVLHGKILGKPANRNEAIAMLGELSGDTHEVISTVVVKAESLGYRTSKSLVRFRETTGQERLWYYENFSPLDKAGAYGIQDAAAAFIDRFEGSYSGVMGLPIKETRQLLQEYGLNMK